MNTVAITNEITLADHIKYVGIAASEETHHVWGCSPIKDEDGRIHLFGARYAGNFNQGWRTDSHIVHYVADSPEGPYRFVEVVYRGERKTVGQWNYFGIHNPTIKKVSGKYALFFIANSNKGGPVPKNQTIGMMTADSLGGPWSEPKQVLTPSDDPKHWTHNAGNGVCNPAFLKMPNGKYHLYYKSEGAKYGVAIADKLEGPYVHHPESVTKNNKTIEDGYAFFWNGKVCLLTTDNHGTIERGGGLLWQSENGINFEKPTRGFFPLEHYAPRSEYPKARKVYNNNWKVERPQLLIENGQPACLYAPSGNSFTGRKYTNCHLFKVMTDKEMEKERRKK